ncbi:hypothetical protein [Sorangium cellulosum]|uniref:Uncharacterized protein n=1 Tax=Sorangium cellulosum So0157-2 TaxID=1254432 RepID=S4Y7K9_SORCE|nr:hypothetical protein [Sorangium cellulosum]AGP41402.1 hypothetical protein SCE1572_47110 [Sorangium cellulosum So0157-2]
MTSLLIDAAVTTLIHDRLKVLHDSLTRKQTLVGFAGEGNGTLTPVTITQVERQVRELARRAVELFEGGARAPVAPGAPRTGDVRTGGTSQYAFLGSAGFSLPSFTDLSGRGKPWISQVLRGGTPDRDLSRVLAPATAFVFEVADKARQAAGTTPGELAAARAFAMGMIGALASNVVVEPLLRGADGTRFADGDWPGISAAQMVEVESAVRRHVFGGVSASDFMSYLPAHDAVKDSLLRGYIEALGAAGMPLAAPRPTGFPDFETGFAPGAPPTVAQLRQAYYLMRASNESWNGWGWFFWLFFFTLPVGLSLPIAAVIDEDKLRWQVSRLFRPESAGVPNPSNEAWSQLASLGFAAGAVGPMALTLWLWPSLPAMWPDFLHGTIGFLIDALGALLLGLSVAAQNAWEDASRWVPLALQAVSRIIFLLRAILDGSPASRTYCWFQTFPLWTALFSLIYGAIADALTDSDAPGNRSELARILLLIGWPVILAVSQIVLAVAVFDGHNPLSFVTRGAATRLPALDRMTGVAPPHALAALLDESTLWAEGAPAAGLPPLDTLRYPPGSARPLLKLWWTGTGELQVRHAGSTFECRIGANGAAQVLHLPPIQFTPRELGTWLAARVTGQPTGTGTIGGLQVDPGGDAPLVAHRLPWPMVMADSGGWVPLGRDAGKAHVLRHASRAQLATPHGQRGPSVSSAEGWPIAPGPGVMGADGSGVGMAAELGALLGLGAATRIHPAPLVPPAGPAAPPPLATVERVFRRWNLDARRVNEWRAIVEGGARSENRAVAPAAAAAAFAPGAPPAPPTEVVPGDPTQLNPAAGSPALMVGTEALVDQLGWLPLFRAWSRVATDPEQDADSELPAPYSPRLRASDGRWVQPTNRQLNAAVRYLLDLP